MRPYSILFLVPALLLAGCATCRRGIPPALPDGEVAAADAPRIEPGAPPDFRLLIGKGGGFTGQWRGFTVHADGGVWTWSGLGMPEDSTRAGALNRADLDSVWADVLSGRLFDRTTEGSGNLSARVEVSGGHKTRVLTWASGLRSDAPDSPEEGFYQRIERLLLDRFDGTRGR
jgi:hypothetical protein